MAGSPILVVDDAPVNLKLMRLLLTHEGYDVRVAARAEDALEMLTSYRPELILADIQLPGMNGLEMTRRVKGNPRTSAIKVVALTACAMKEDQERAMKAGCDDYISKPINTAALASKVRSLIEQSRAETISSASESLNVSGPQIDSLRRRFLNDGAEQSRQLLDSLDSGFDRAHAARLLHQWIGTAALLGESGISALAGKGEEFLRQEQMEMSHARAVFTDLLLTFAELRESLNALVPDYVAEATRGKRIALVGFSVERADDMCAALERVKARPLLFDASDDPASHAIRDCDLALFHVRPETLESEWLQADAPFPASLRVVFAGDQPDLVVLPLEVRSRALDFIVGRTEPLEVLMRLAFAISRTLAAVQTPEEPVVEAPVRQRTAIACPRVVLADDDAIVRSLVGSALQNFGMACQAAQDGTEGLEMIRRERPDAAVLDVSMPGMDGYTVLAAIRAEKLPVRVILLTSHGQEKDILRAFNLGADDYVTKPFNPFELVARLKRLLQ